MMEIARDLQHRGVALTVLVYSWPQQLPYLSRPSRAEIVWAEWASANRADFINLFRKFSRLGDPTTIQREYYLQKDWHWNARGHAWVAELLLGRFRPMIVPPEKPASPPVWTGS